MADILNYIEQLKAETEKEWLVIENILASVQEQANDSEKVS